MRRTRLFVLAGVIAMSAVGVADGRECAGVGFPDQVEVEGTALVLNGLGLRQATIFKVNVYVAALYTARATSDATAILGSTSPKQVVLHFVRNVGAGDLNKAWDEGFAVNAKAQLAALKERIETLKGWMADMKAGERLALTQMPGAGTQIEVGKAAKGTIPGDDFARALLSIWLGDHPPNAGLKVGLLGGPCS